MHKILLNFLTPVASKISTDGAWRSNCRIGCPGPRSKTFDYSVALDAQCNDIATHHELNKRLIKWLAFVLCVVLGKQLASWSELLHRNNAVTLRFDATDNLTD